MSPLGLEPGVVRVVDYDPEWPALFEREAARIVRAVHKLPLVLHHIGSTAVPGLAARPVLDMLAGYQEADPAALWKYITAITTAGYQYRGEEGIPGREFFRRGDPRAYHLHLADVGSEFFRENLAFRDVLRSDAALREAYATLKHELFRKYPQNRAAYIEGKEPFVMKALGKA
jgi:GrpB-like predicted nucleotidyltransferase (UPF0157 family)